MDKAYVRVYTGYILYKDVVWLITDFPQVVWPFVLGHHKQ